MSIQLFFNRSRQSSPRHKNTGISGEKISGNLPGRRRQPGSSYDYHSAGAAP